jgi:hypothetical protein
VRIAEVHPRQCWKGSGSLFRRLGSVGASRQPLWWRRECAGRLVGGLIRSIIAEPHGAGFSYEASVLQ